MRVVHMIPSAGPASFGGGVVALNLVREQCRLGVGSEIWSLDTAADREWASRSYGVDAEAIKCFAPSLPARALWSRKMERAARREGPGIALVHQHAIWSGLSRIPNLLRERNGIKTVVTPHGSLQEWAVKKSNWKKKIALTLYEGDNLKFASCFHAVGANEYIDIREYGLKNPVAVIPNCISTDWLQSSGDESVFRQQYGIRPDQRILLYLSRVTPKKGLLMLLEAIDANRDSFADWCLIIAGADEFNHQAEVEAEIQRRGLTNSVILAGPLFGQMKRDAFAAAELFVLPSYSEGAPIVILEALGAGVPVIATKASPWPQLTSHGCGWWTDIEVNAIAEALQAALSRSPEQLRQMGQAGKALMVADFTWQQAAQKTVRLYDWLLGHGTQPDFVITD